MSTPSDARPTPSQPWFTGATIDRAAELRADPVKIADLLTASEPVAVIRSPAGVAVDGDGTRLARIPWDGNPEEAVLLGLDDGRPVLAVVLDRDDDLPAGSRPMHLRDVGTTLPQAEGGLAAYLVALLNWHDRHQFCSVCGNATDIVEAGLARKCPNCGASHFPRTDPVVIMTVEFDDQLLMGSRVGWPSERYSVLAGFVASAETPEEAVVREVREESGIEARDATYVGSQPWPFPASLMLGFHAHADGGVPTPGGDNELSDVRWFPRDEVAAMQRDESPLKLPGEVSIARHLIDRWAAR